MIGLVYNRDDSIFGYYKPLMHLLNSCMQGFLPPVLVFVQSIERARELFHELVYEGINVDVIHAGRTQQQVSQGRKESCV